MPRCLGPRALFKRANKKHPRIKHPIEVKDLAQPYGRGFWLEAPRPTKIVLPVAIVSWVVE